MSLRHPVVAIHRCNVIPKFEARKMLEGCDFSTDLSYGVALSLAQRVRQRNRMHFAPAK